jgi:CDP-diacylglycerol--inositol 3-phosphatidyltransferase
MVSVYLYVPNLIGYVRILLIVVAFHNISDYKTFFICYALSQVLDMADGYAARLLKQSTKYGAVLDMVTDRASTACLLVVLGHFYPKYMSFFLFCVGLDIISHFTQVSSSLMLQLDSHKVGSSPLMRLYYGNRYFLAFMCAGNEGFFLFLYLLNFYSGPLVTLPSFLTPVVSLLTGSPRPTIEFVKFFAFFVCGPVMALKQWINIEQWISAGAEIANKIDNKKKQV